MSAPTARAGGVAAAAVATVALVVLVGAQVMAATGQPPAPGGGPGVARAAEASTSTADVGDPPPFRGSVQPLPRDLRRRMRGVSWRPGCPVPRRDLRLLRMRHRGFDGEVHAGRMVVAATVADDVLAAFRRVYRAGYPIRRMRLVEAYDGSDRRSMRRNNTSAFNCRTVTGGSGFSEHAYGTAIDVNPVQNPYVKDATVQPRAGRAYLDRSDARTGMIVRPGPVVRAFRKIGWTWGGDYRSLKDYQHFSSSGG